MRKNKKYSRRDTQYKKIIRISEKHLKWLMLNKTTRTMAGYLAQIIERHISWLKIHKLDHQELKEREKMD
jgi:hypothetical protein